MKEIEVGTKVLVRAEVEAFRTGLNSGPKVRVRIGDQAVWAKAEDLQMMPQLHMPRGSYKWDGIISAQVSPDPLCTGNPEDGVTEETDGNL